MMWPLPAIVLLMLTQAESSSVQVCGSALDEMLRLVCGNRGFYFLDHRDSPSKRSVGITPSGIVAECCLRPCSINQMNQYCATSGLVQQLDGDLYRAIMRYRPIASGTTSAVNAQADVADVTPLQDRYDVTTPQPMFFRNNNEMNLFVNGQRNHTNGRYFFVRVLNNSPNGKRKVVV